MKDALSIYPRRTVGRDAGPLGSDLYALQILDGKTKGYCTHADVTAAYKVMGGHTDPGPNFPVQKLLDLIEG